MTFVESLLGIIVALAAALVAVWARKENVKKKLEQEAVRANQAEDALKKVSKKQDVEKEVNDLSGSDVRRRLRDKWTRKD